MSSISSHGVEKHEVRADAAEAAVASVRLVVLSGGIEPARRAVADRYPNAEVETLDKELLRGRERYALLRSLRLQPCDRFVYFTYVNAWQLDRFRMALFAWLTGARRVVVLDTEHAADEFGAARLFARELPRTVLEVLLAVPVLLLGLVLSWALELICSAKPRRFADAPASSDRALDVLLVRPTPTIGVMEAGESAHIRGVLDGLNELGHRTRVLSNDNLPAISRAGHELEVRRPGTFFNSMPLAFEVWQNLRFTLALWRATRRATPDLIYQRHSRNSWAGVAVSRLTRIPLLLEWNGSEVWATRHWAPVSGWSWIVSVFERVNRRGADRIVVVSQALASALTAEGVAAARIVVNPNGVDPARFHPGAGGAAIRERYGFGDRLVIGFVGSFNHYQGTEMLMRAAPAVCAEADASFLMVGYGETLPAAVAAAEAGGVADRVVFTDRVPVDDVPAYVDASDVAVAPMVPNPDGSDFFNSPVKIFEYMAAGKAIVASRLGQISEIIEDGVTGLLVEPDSPKALSDAIVRLAKDPGLRERLGKAALEAAVEKHTWRRNAARVLETYDAVVAEGVSGLSTR